MENTAALDEGNFSRGNTLSEEVIWGSQQVLLLINHVEEFFEQFHSGTKKKKVIWQEIAEKMQEKGYNFTGSDCDKKWRNLKATYLRVLQKHIRGETGYRFEYFDLLHPILGKEINPLPIGRGETEDVRNKMSPNRNPSLSFADGTAGNYEYQEISVDDVFVWIHSAVTLLLELIQKFFKDAPSHSLTQERWEDVAKQMVKENYDVNSVQCQRKWENLQDGFYYHQANISSTESEHPWPYFTQVRDLMIALNIPVTVQVNLSTDSGKRQMRGQNPCKITLKKRFLNKGQQYLSKKQILSRIQQLESHAGISQRLSHLEEQVEEIQHKQEIYNHTNNLLRQIVGEFRKINQMLESDDRYKYEYHSQQRHIQHHIPRPDSPNQGIIIVEDISGPL